MAIRKSSSAPQKNSPKPLEWYEDEIIAEVHRIRDEYTASLGHDLKRILADLQAHQAKSKLRVCKPAKKK